MNNDNIFKDVFKMHHTNRIKDKVLHDLIGSYFTSTQQTESFINDCLLEYATRYALNRLEWFIELADYQNNHSCKILFLLAMAETNIKLLNNRFNDNEHTNKDICEFFNKFSDNDKKLIKFNFFKIEINLDELKSDEKLENKISIEYNTIIDILYNVRNSVVHGKESFCFRFHDGTDTLSNHLTGRTGPKKSKKDLDYECEVTYDKFREIMIKNAVRNIGEKIQNR